jgi:hypothetical protein
MTDPVQDLAVDFVEQELGRLDFHRNWHVFKQKFPDPESRQKRVQDWMDRIGLEGNPKDVLDRIEDLSQQTGFWH